MFTYVTDVVTPISVHSTVLLSIVCSTGFVHCKAGFHSNKKLILENLFVVAENIYIKKWNSTWAASYLNLYSILNFLCQNQNQKPWLNNTQWEERSVLKWMHACWVGPIVVQCPMWTGRQTRAHSGASSAHWAQTREKVTTRWKVAALSVLTHGTFNEMVYQNTLSTWKCQF